MIEYYNDICVLGSDSDMENREGLIKRLRAVAAIVLVALYALGLVAMMTSRVQLALILWVISTLGGIGLLYWMRTVTKRKEDAAKAEGQDPASGEN